MKGKLKKRNKCQKGILEFSNSDSNTKNIWFFIDENWTTFCYFPEDVSLGLEEEIKIIRTQFGTTKDFKRYKNGERMK